MSKTHEELEKMFHEPSRMALMSHLCGARGGLSFNELKEACRMTDGNLSRHLKALETGKAVKIEKSFVGAKPRTTVFVTREGREGFLKYLDVLEQVLKQAALRAKPEKQRGKAPAGMPKTVASQ
jgi:DNA-binding transcriptional ArsR family regulator